MQLYTYSWSVVWKIQNDQTGKARTELYSYAKSDHIHTCNIDLKTNHNKPFETSDEAQPLPNLVCILAIQSRVSTSSYLDWARTTEERRNSPLLTGCDGHEARVRGLPAELDCRGFNHLGHQGCGHVLRKQTGSKARHYSPGICHSCCSKSIHLPEHLRHQGQRLHSSATACWSLHPSMLWPLLTPRRERLELVQLQGFQAYQLRCKFGSTHIPRHAWHG